MRGRQGGSHWGPAKPTTADAYKLPIAQVVRTARGEIRRGDPGAQSGALLNGSFHWFRGSEPAGSITYSVSINGILVRGPDGAPGSWAPSRGHGELLLRYQVDEGDVREERIDLEARRPGLGGQRWYGRCPGCRRLVRVLWGWGAVPFRCVPCNGLAYVTAQSSKRDRPLIMARRIGAKLGEVPDLFEMGVAPPKPDWMRWPTYRRLAEEIQERARQEVRLLPRLFQGLASEHVAMVQRYSRPESPNEARRRKRWERAERASSTQALAAEEMLGDLQSRSGV